MMMIKKALRLAPFSRFAGLRPPKREPPSLPMDPTHGKNLAVFYSWFYLLFYLIII
jgi:hypothetical protein